jgi:transcriptional regulator with XRE-family HTH domain
MMNQLSRRLQRLMEDKKFKQAQSAKRAGIAQSTINRIIHSKNSPTYRILQRLATGFGVPVEYFTHPSETIADIILELSTLPDPAREEVLKYIKYQKQSK